MMNQKRGLIEALNYSMVLDETTEEKRLFQTGIVFGEN